VKVEVRFLHRPQPPGWITTTSGQRDEWAARRVGSATSGQRDGEPLR
jgi:hypothetical protein